MCEDLDGWAEFDGGVGGSSDECASKIGHVWYTLQRAG